MTRRWFVDTRDDDLVPGNSILAGDYHALAVATHTSVCMLDVRSGSRSGHAMLAAEWCVADTVTGRGDLQAVDDITGGVGALQCLAMLDQHSAVAAGSSSGIAAVIDRRTGSLLYRWRAHEAPILKLLPLHDGRLMTVSADQTAMVWDLTASQPQGAGASGTGASQRSVTPDWSSVRGQSGLRRAVSPPTLRGYKASSTAVVPSWKAAAQLGVQRWAMHRDVREGWHRPLLAPLRALGSDVGRVMMVHDVAVSPSTGVGSDHAIGMWSDADGDVLLSAAGHRLGVARLGAAVRHGCVVVAVSAWTCVGGCGWSWL